MGDVVTDATGAWSADITTLSCTALPVVQAQAVAGTTDASQAATAVLSARTLTSASGMVVMPQTTVLGANLAAIVGLSVVPVKRAAGGVVVSVVALCR